MTTGVLASVLMLGLSACEVEQTETGALPDVDVSGDAGQIPKYEVDVKKTREGKMPSVDVDVKGGKMPAFKVRGPEVEVGTKEVTITVPDVDIDTRPLIQTQEVYDMKTKFVGFALLLVFFTAGCNTVSGVGKDIEAAGEAVEETAEKAKKEMNID